MLQVARVTSMVFTPFSIPFLSFLVLFLFSYLRIMPIQYKLIVLGIVYCFTILTPTITIFLFRKINGFARQELSERKKRYVPILLTIISYVFCLLMMRRLNIPWYMTGIILASLGSVYHLHCSKPEMEVERTHGRNGRGDRRLDFFQCLVRLQSGRMAMPVYFDCRYIGFCTHCSGTSHTG